MNIKPYYAEKNIILYNADCYELLNDIKGDFLLTDPPYNVGRDYGCVSDNLPMEEYLNKMKRIIDFGRANTKNRMAFILGYKRIRDFWLMMPDAHLVIVDHNVMRIPTPDNWQHQYSGILIVGKPLIRCHDRWSGIRYPGEGYFFKEERYPHPGLTPQKLVARILTHFTSTNETIVDPFAGTGTTLVIAKRMGRQAIGIEINKVYCDIAIERLSQCVLELEGE